MPLKRKEGKGLLVTRLQFRKDHRRFADKQTIIFRPGVNLLVGEAFCGKSTLLQLLCDLASPPSEWQDKASSLARMAGRAQNVQSLNLRAPFGESGSFSDMHKLLKSSTLSHEGMIEALLDTLTDKEPTLVLLDELDIAFSPKGAEVLARRLEDVAHQGHQIVAAAYSPIMIASQPEVFSVEQGRWLDPSEFLSDAHLLQN